MTNLLEARVLQRLGMVAGVFLIWSVAFFALVRPAQTPAEILVLVPVVVSAMFLGVRGGLAGSLIGVLGISTFHVIAGTGPFTQLLQGGSPGVVVVVFAAGAMVGYGRTLKTERATASQLAISTQDQLVRLDTESRLLLRLSIEIGRSTVVESIGAAASVALSGVIAFDRLSLYMFDSARGTARIAFTSGEDHIGPARDDEFPIEEIMAIDPFEIAQLVGDGADPIDGRQLQPTLIMQGPINDGAESIALLRLWSYTGRELSGRDKKYVRSVAAQITPALKRASLQTSIERDAGVDAVVSEFAEITHKSLRIDAVVGSAARHIGRNLETSHVALAVTDLDGRRITVRQGNDEGQKGFGISEIRTLAEALADPLADYQTRVVSVEECEVLAPHSEVAHALAKSNLGSFIVLNLQYEGELIAQLWIGYEEDLAISSDHVEYVTRIGHHLASALANARKSERTQELQRQFVGQNEQFAYMQDVLERAEAELNVSNQNLAELSESKSQFMSAVAHELKTPLSIIIGYAGLLHSGPGKLTADQREYIDLMENSAQQLLALADDLGDVSKMDSGKFSITKRTHDICAVMKSVVDDLNISASTSHRRIEYTAPSAMQMFDGDPDRLAQVFTNLITNALKYSTDDRPVKVTVGSHPGQLKIVVTDHGLGISKSDQDKLFAPFFRSTNPEALRRTGTGLGLVVAKSIVEEHGGNLRVSSELGAGSIFTVELPLRMNTEEALSA